MAPGGVVATGAGVYLCEYTKELAMLGQAEASPPVGKGKARGKSG